MTSMKTNRFKRMCGKILRIGFVWSLFVTGFLGAQPVPAPSFDISEEEIEQGRNRGVETWEGTLFGQDSYKPGAYAQVEAVPNPGFEFERWEGAQLADPENAKTVVNMMEHVKIKPRFNRVWNVIAAPDNKEAGEVKGSGNYPDGTEVTLSVEPKEGFKFLGWEGKGIDEAKKEELQTTIRVDGDHDIIARFENENQDQDSGGGGGGGGDSDQNENQDQQDEQNQDESEQDQNEAQQDQSDQNEDQRDEGNQEEQPQETESGEEEPAEPEEGDQGEEGEEPQPPGGEEEAPARETPAGGQPVPTQMTPEEAVRLLDAMEGDEKKLPLFIVTPPDNKKDSKKDW